MSRQEVHVLSQRRREELRRMREEAERRHQQDVVLRLGDIKVLIMHHRHGDQAARRIHILCLIALIARLGMIWKKNDVHSQQVRSHLLALGSFYLSP